MGNPFSKNGAITKLVEAVPGGGLITAPIHAAAGNPIHAAAIGGIGSMAGAVLSAGSGPAGGIVAGATTAGLRGIFDQLELSDDKKELAVRVASSGNSNEATKILLEAGQEKIAVSTKELSADAGGRRNLKSCHGYLRAVEPDWRVDLMNGAPKEWENWYIEDWGGKVVLKGRGGPDKPGQFLRAHPNGAVDLVGTHPNEWEMWKPFKNDNGSWSLLSVHGKWLSARDDGSVCTVDICREWEHFWLERWLRTKNGKIRVIEKENRYSNTY